jgi:RNA polymerase sigma-70 factor (ECF subfamily)
MAEESAAQLQQWLTAMNAGDTAARDQLFAYAGERLCRLTRQIFQDYRRVQHFEDTHDVLQNAVLRLLRSLQARPPLSMQEFFRAAAREIRRELLDLARHYYGPHGPGTHQAALPEREPSTDTPVPAAETSDSTNEPARLARWTEFHQRVESLPDEERTAFDLLWYQGLAQEEAAAVLGISLATLKRRWLAARLRLQDTFGAGGV